MCRLEAKPSLYGGDGHIDQSVDTKSLGVALYYVIPLPPPVYIFRVSFQSIIFWINLNGIFKFVFAVYFNV